MIVFLDNNRILPRIKSDLSDLLKQFADKFQNGVYDNPFINIYDLSKQWKVPFFEADLSRTDKHMMKIGTLDFDGMRPGEIFIWRNGSTVPNCSFYDFTKCKKEYSELDFNGITIKKIEYEYTILKDSEQSHTNYYPPRDTHNVKRSNWVVIWKFYCEYKNEEFQIISQDNIHKIIPCSSIGWVSDYESYFSSSNKKEIYRDSKNNSAFDYGDAKTVWELDKITEDIVRLRKYVNLKEINLQTFGFTINSNIQYSNKIGFKNENDFIYSLLSIDVKEDNEEIKLVFNNEIQKNLTPYYLFLFDAILGTNSMYKENIEYICLKKENAIYKDPIELISYIALNICHIFKNQNQNKYKTEKDGTICIGDYLEYKDFLCLSDCVTFDRFRQLTGFKHTINDIDYINRMLDLLTIKARSDKSVLYRLGDHDDEIFYHQEVNLTLLHDNSDIVLNIYKEIIGKEISFKDNKITYKAEQFETADRFDSGYKEDYSVDYKKHIILKAMHSFYDLYSQCNEK